MKTFIVTNVIRRCEKIKTWCMKPDKAVQNKVIDLSKGVEMTPEHARSFNQIADGIRQEYIELVNNISIKNGYDLDWFVTPFACRNTYVCNVFEDVVRIFFIREVINEEEGIDTLIVDTPLIEKVVRAHIPDSMQIISKQSNMQYYLSLRYNLISGLFKYLISSLLRYISFKLVSLFVTNQSSVLKSKPVVVVETYLYNNSFKKEEFSDRHFSKIRSYLSESQVNRVLYIPMFYKVKNSYSLYLKAFKSKTNFLFVEAHISLSDIFYPLRHPFRLDYTQSNIKIRDIDISRLVNHSLVRHSTHTSSLAAILKYRFCCNLKKNSSISIDQVVRWYENQEIDHGSIMGWREYSHSLHIVGYMGFFPSSNYLCAYPIPEEHSLRITPDCIGVMGRGLIDHHKKFCESLNIEVVPSFRFPTPIFNTQSRHKETSEIKVLVALPISQQHISTVLKVIAGVAPINDESPILFVIKAHPASNISLDGSLIDSNKVRYMVVNDSIMTLFDEVDFVVSMASSTIMQAIMHGLHVIVVSSTQSLSENVIPDIVPNILWDEVYDADELYDIIIQQKRHGKLSIDKLTLLNSEIIGLQPNPQNVVNFLGGFTHEKE